MLILLQSQCAVNLSIIWRADDIVDQMLEWESHQTIDWVFFIKEVFAWQDWYVCCDIEVNPIYLKALPFSGRLLLTGSEYTKSTVFSMFKVWCRVTPHFIFFFTSSAAEVIADWESIGNVQEFVSKVSLFSAAIAKTYKRRISSCRTMFSIALPSYLIMACCKWANLCRKRCIHTGPCMSHALRSL